MFNLDTFFQRTISTTVDFFERLMPMIPVFIILLLVGIIFIKIISWSIKKALKAAKLPLGLLEILFPVIDFILWVSLVLLGLHLLGFSNLILAIGGSLAVVIFGMTRGVSSTVSDLFSGIFLAKDKDFGVGVKVKILIGEKRLVEGEIVEMDTRKTRIKDAEDKIHVLPNSMIDHNEWIVLKHKQVNRKNGIIKDNIISKMRKNK